MSLLSSLNAGASALDAQSYALQITGKNVANVNNSNYARERVVMGTGGMETTSIGTVSFDVLAKSVTQMRDAFLDQQVAQEISVTNGLQTQQQALERAQAGLGESINQTANSSSTGTSTTNSTDLSSQIDGFFNGFQSLATNPTDVGERQTLLQQANILTDNFHQIDGNLAQVQSDLTTQAQSDTQTVNTLLSTIASLNGQIARFEATKPGSAVDLRDQRQQAIEQLAAKLSFSTKTATNANGQIQVDVTDTSGNTIALVDGATVTNSVSFDGTNLTAGGATLAQSGGSISGAVTARDGTIQTLRDNLDALASQLVTSVNAAYNPSGSTGDFFTAGGTTAATIALDPSVTVSSLKASDGGAAGDNTVALAVANLSGKNFSTGSGDAIDGTFTQYYAGTVSAFGEDLAGLNTQVTNQTAVQNLVQNQRDSVSGVNLDEETTNLMLYQRAFEASSRFVTVINSLLDTVVNKLGIG